MSVASTKEGVSHGPFAQIFFRPQSSRGFMFLGSNPSVLPRVLGVFAKIGMVPTRWYSVVTGRRRDELHIDIQMVGLAPAEAEHLAQSLRRIVFVDTVLTSEKRDLRSA